MKKKIFLPILFLIFTSNLLAQLDKSEIPTTRILFIFDCSRSMNGQWQSGKKIDIARRVFIRLLDSLKHQKNLELALRMYGHQSPVPPQNCNDTKLEIPFAKDNIERIKKKLLSTDPNGTTPIAKSLEQCANDFPRDPNARNVIILITDGKEECGGDPCRIAMALRSKGISLRPFVIGIGLDVEIKKAFECVGEFYDAPTEKDFEDFFEQIIRRTSGYTTMQINLLDIYNKPKETNVNMTMYNMETGEQVFNLVHTMDKYGYPDTMYLDPIPHYRIDVHTIPSVSKKNILLKPGRHNIIPISTPQGSLEVKTADGFAYKKHHFVIRKNNKTVNYQEFYKTQKYLVGTYDIELFTLPRLYFNDIKIEQSKTTSIKVKKPGIATIIMPSKGYGGVYVYDKKNNSLNWVYSLDNTTKEVLLLQPGKYIAVHRPEKANRMSFTVSKEFTVQSEKSYHIQMRP